MGNLCTGENNIVVNGLGEQDEEEFDDLQNQKVPPPNETIAYNMSHLPNQQKSEGNLTKLQEQLSTMKANERKGKKQITVVRQHAPGCYLKDPYIIRCLEAIYVGQWKYNSNLASSVPGGIGRLYTMDEILEGQMITEFDEKEKDKVEFHEDIAETMIRENKKRAKFFLRGQKDTISLSYASDQTMNIKVLLDGIGRIFSRTKELQGFFKKGLLHGKGEMEIKYGKDVYHYKGQFSNGLKSGKGIEKFKGTTYDGQFDEDFKKGKGSLTLFISNKFEKEEQEENQRIKAEHADKNPTDIIREIDKYINLRKNYFEKKINNVLKEKYPWEEPDPIKADPFIYNSDFLLQHIRKTKFPEHYKGSFENNKFHGPGKYTWFNGKVYEGDWEEGRMHGTGQFYWQKGGHYYQGQYQDDLKHGKGTMYWSLTKRYRGQWFKGFRHGYGQLISIEKVDEPVQVDPEKEKRKNTFFGKIGNKLGDMADKIEDQLQEMGLDDEDVFVDITIIGAIFNKDKMHEDKYLFKKTERIPLDLDKVRRAEKKMECIVKGIRYNEEDALKD